MKVKNRDEAWRVADILFPTDYLKDDRSSKRAGYDIYKSTAEGNKSWISDLGTRLELNIWEGDCIRSTLITIESEPEIIEKVIMTVDDVMSCCIKHNFYTAGTCAEYSKMLEVVRENSYSIGLLYRIAKDIAEHSTDQTVENVMCHLSNDAICRCYEIIEN